MGEYLPREDPALFDELHPHPLVGEALDEGSQVIKLRASRFILCTTTVSQCRANRSSSVSSGLEVSQPEAFLIRKDPV